MHIKIETPAGVLPHRFASEADAEEYAIGVLSWSGTRYRFIYCADLPETSEEVGA